MATQTIESCQDQVKACEDVLASGNIVIQRQAETITLLSDQNAALKRALETGSAIINAPTPWYKDTWFLIGVGAVAGVMAHKELQR